jgi:hypothetical protein
LHSVLTQGSPIKVRVFQDCEEAAQWLGVPIEPSQTGLRTHGDGDFRTHCAASALSTTAPGEESSSIRAIAARRQMTARTIQLSGTQLLFELHVNAAASGVDINAFLRGGKADYHTGLICHDGASFPTAKSHAAGARGTDIIMTVEILKMLEIENLAIRGTACHADFAYR